MFRLKGCLCILLLWIVHINHSFAFGEIRSGEIRSAKTRSGEVRSGEARSAKILSNAIMHHLFPRDLLQRNSIIASGFTDTLKTSLKPTPRKPKTLLKRKNKGIPKKKEHPRKKLVEDEPMHTQRTWLYSTIVPGLGQVYNKDYWKMPLIYGVFGILTWAATYNHTEYVTARREFIEKYGDANLSEHPKLGNQVEGFKRERTIWIAAIGLWYLINIFDAYVGGTLTTFDVSDDLAVIVQPTEPKDTKNNPSIGLTISLQQKDEDRLSWLR